MATIAQQESFIRQITPLIQREAANRGYKVCSAVIAQACLESAYGLSGLAKHFNYFGLKTSSSWKGKSVIMSTKEEYTVGNLTTIKAGFRAYDNMAAGIAGYYDFINTKRYANLKTATTAQQYLEYIKADEYATSAKYVANNMMVVNRHDLTRFDVGISVTQTANLYQIGKTYTLQSDMYVRQSPNGEKIKFDSLTEDGKRNGKFDSEGNAILKKGTRVTCKGISGQWMKIPSGYVCTMSDSGRVYIA